ncbi:MerR family transcriptional regulator [Enterococcus faecalis]|uniref:MerR family transcriptional regulator n=1 Tax=Enterococcus faecalis TaxID=1351 RepID=UPI0020913943|nr:MerR family transcriptional regulator [Enterococcus faecalis]MCO5422236.1 MerR family transcriptional regulator [Enterococcus faecalis]
MISISDLAKLFNTTLRTIRYYEERGLIEKSIRVNGRRYYNKENVVIRMHEIFFLKSLNLKIEDIKLAMENPLYIRPIAMNIRLGQLRIELQEIICEIDFLETKLKELEWLEVEIDDYYIFEKMKGSFYELSKEEKIINSKKNISTEEAKKFVNNYINWHKKIGFNITDNHIKLIAFSKNISLNSKIKTIFKQYFL